VKNFQSDGRVTNQDQLEQTAKKKKKLRHLHNLLLWTSIL